MTGIADLAGRSVLIVEDEFLLALDVAELLESVGMTVAGSFSTCRDALAYLEGHSPDLAVLDLNLTDETTEPVAAALGDRRIPFLVLSGYGQGYMDQMAMRDAPLIEKPYDTDILLEALAALLPG